jgi:hypothetical protein
MSSVAADPLTNLRSAYSEEFTLWRSDAGCCYATRKRRLSNREMEAGLLQTVSADDAAELGQRLRVQEGLLDRV